MSVGAGSIKRAAKAAEGKTEANALKTVEEKAVTEADTVSPKPAAEVKKSKAAAVKKKSAKSAGKKASSKKTNSASKNTEKAESKKLAAASSAAYGIGQDLPIHLM